MVWTDRIRCWNWLLNRNPHLMARPEPVYLMCTYIPIYSAAATDIYYTTILLYKEKEDTHTQVTLYVYIFVYMFVCCTYIANNTNLRTADVAIQPHSRVPFPSRLPTTTQPKTPTQPHRTPLTYYCWMAAAAAAAGCDAHRIRYCRQRWTLYICAVLWTNVLHLKEELCNGCITAI